MAKYIKHKNINSFVSWGVTLKFFQSIFLTYIYNRVKMFVDLFGTLRLPRKVIKLRLLRSPHVNKKSMESFEVRSSKYLTYIFNFNIYKDLRFLIDSMSVFYMHFLFEFNKNKVFIFKKWNYRSYLSMPLLGIFDSNISMENLINLNFSNNSSILVNILIITVGFMLVRKEKKKIISCFTNFKWKLGPMLSLVVFPTKFEEFSTTDNIKSRVYEICKNYVVEEDYKDLPMDESSWYAGGWAEEIDKDGNVILTYDSLKALHDPVNIDEITYDPTVYGKSKNVEFFLRKEEFIQKVLNVLDEQELKKLKQLYDAQWFARDKDPNFSWSHFYNMETGELYHVEDLYNWKLIRHIHEVFWLERQVLDLNLAFDAESINNVDVYDSQGFYVEEGLGINMAEKITEKLQNWQKNVQNSVWFDNNKKKELASSISDTLYWLRMRHVKIPFDKYKSLKYNSYRQLKQSESYPDRSFSEIFKPYVLDADGVIESERTKVNIFGKDFTLPINFTEFDRQAITFINQLMHDWFWKEKTYKWSWEDFKTWIEQENVNTGSLTEEQLKTYAEGLETRYTLENMFTYEKSWYSRLIWYTHDHPYYTRVMKDRVYSWVESYDDETGEASMMAFRDGFWIDTVSCSEYLKIVRGEQDLVNERERIVYDAGLYYDQYSNSLDFARRVRWVKEYSETLSYYVDDLITDKLNFGDLALPKELLAKDSIGWFKAWPSYGSVMWDDRLDYKLESLYLSWISIFHTNIWHVTTYGGLYGGLSWLLFIIILDIVTSHRRMRGTVLGLRWRRLRNRLDDWWLDKSGWQISYHDGGNAWMYVTGGFWAVKYYHWLDEKSEYDYGHAKLRENMKNLHELNDGKRGRIYSYNSRTEGYGFLHNCWEDDQLDRVYRPAILRNNNKNLGRAGYFSEKQTELSNLWNPVKYAFDILYVSASELINRFLFQHGFSRALLKAVLVEAAFVNKILNTLLDIPIKVSVFISVYTYQLFIFILSLPKEIFNMPGYIINISVAVIKSIINMYQGIIYSIKFLFEEVISLWFFIFNVLNYTVKLWFYLIFIKPFESIWNFLDYCFNINFWFLFFKNWVYSYKLEMFAQRWEVMLQRLAFKWVHKNNLRFYPETRMTNDWLQDLNTFGNYIIGFDKLRAGTLETLNIWYDEFTWKCWLLLDHTIVVFNQVKYLGFKDFFHFRLQRFCDKSLEHYFYKYYVTFINDDPSRKLEWAYFRAYLENIYWPYLKEVFALNFSYYKGLFVHVILHGYNRLFYVNEWSYYVFSWGYSFIYYPIFYVWRHTFGQAWVTILYLTNLIWHWDYYSFSGGLSFSRLITSFGYSFSIFVAHIFNFFVQLKVMFIEGCKFYFEGIFYPFICLYWYFIKSKDFFISSFMNNYGLYVSVFYHSSVSVYIRTFFNDLRTIYNMALGTTNDLASENIKISLEESEDLVKKLSVSDLYNNKQKYSKDVVETYEKDPEAFVTDTWNLDPKITQASIDVYEELSKVNLFEDHYPLTASERVLDSLDMLDKSQRNIDVLRALGRWHESVILQTIVYENHIDHRNYSWGFEKLPIHAKIWVPLHDYLVDFIPFSPIAPNLRRWIGETYVVWVLDSIKYFFYTPVMFQYIFGAFFKIPRYIYSTCSYIYSTLSNMLDTLIKLPGYFVDVFCYFSTYLRVTFGLTFNNFDLQFFIDMFYYWYYYVPHSYWKPRYLKHIMQDHWLYTANRFNYINKTFNFKPDGRWQNWRGKTSLWNRVYIKYWEGVGNNKSYFWLNRFVTFWQLIFSHRTPVQEREYQAKYVDSIKDEVKIKIYWVFNYIPYWFKIIRRRYIEYENVQHWFLTPNLRYRAKAKLKMNDQYVGGLYPFKGQELIDFYKTITSYYISYAKEWIADFIYTGIVECFGWIHTFLVRITPGGFYFHIMLMAIHELKQGIFYYGTPYLLHNKAIVNSDFHKEFTYVYLKFLIDFKEDAVNFLTTYQIIIVDYSKLLFNRWYVEPIKLKYNIDIIEIYKLPFSHYILFFTGISYDLLWYYIKLICSIVKFSLVQTWDGLEVIWTNILKFTHEITSEYILLLKVKIGFSIVKYFQGLEERICTLEGLFFGLNEPKESFRTSARLLFSGSLFEISNLFLSSIKFIILLFKYLLESFGLIIMWTLQDFWSYFKLLLSTGYSLFGKFIFTLYEIYVLVRVNFLYLVESVFTYSVKFIYNVLRLFYGFCSAVYSWFWGMTAEYIWYFSNCIYTYFHVGYLFIEEFFKTYCLTIELVFIAPIKFTWELIKYIVSIFIHYNPKDGRISYFNLERLYLKFFVYFTDFYMFCSSDEFWWNNVFFMHVYRSFIEPLTNFMRDVLPLESERYVIAPKMFSETFFEKAKDFQDFTNLQGITGLRAKGIRGDYNRRMPWLIGEDQDHVSQSTMNLMWDTFDYQGLSNAFPTRIRNLWSMNKYISGYILMLEKTNLPDPVKRHFYLKRMRELYYHSMVTLGGKSHTYKEIRYYFKRTFTQDIFGKGKSRDALAVYNKIHRYDQMLDAMDEVVRRYRVPDFMFRYWFTHRNSGRWKTPEIWNQLSDKDVFLLQDDADTMFDDLNRFNMIKIFSARDTYPRIFTHGYQNFHSRALDTYDFMAFNQKVYNFYLDMYGPTFAYILYHFPGHSLQLNADDLTLAERVQWLKDFVYRTESNLISATSLVHRLSNFEFQKRMEHYEDGVKWNYRWQNYFFLESQHQHRDAIRDLLRYGQPQKLWGFANVVDHRYSLQYPIIEYDTIFNDDNFIETYYNSYFCGFGEEDMFGFDESWYPEWDIPQRDLGIRHAWKIPVDAFYTSDFIDYKNSILLQFLFKETYHYNCVWNPTTFRGIYQSDYKAWGVLPNGYALIGDLLKIHRPDLAKEFWGHGVETENGSIASYREYLYLQNRIMSRFDYNWMDTFRRTFLVTKDVYYSYMFGCGDLYTHREARPVVFDAPNIDVIEYNNILHKRMNNKPLCYDYWVFYEDNVASSLNNFENLNVLNESMFYDAPSQWQMGFQDPASPIMEGIIDLHHDLCFFLILVSVFVSWVLFNIIYYFNSTNYNLKVRIQKWVHEEVRETLLDLVNMWYSFTIKLVDYSAKNKDNGLVNLVAQKCYNLTMLFIYWENTYFNKWYHDKELEHLVITSKLHSNSLLPENITDILKYIGKNDYNKVEYFFNEVEKKGYFVSKDNEELYNQFKNDPNTTCYSNRLGTILSNLVSIRDLQLQLSNSYFTDMTKEKSYIDSVIADDILAYEKFEEDFEEYQLKEEFVWFPQLFTHNTTIEVIWTIIPAVILIFIAVPSFSLLYAMDQIWQPLFTIKVLGNQWYWSYEYC